MLQRQWVRAMKERLAVIRKSRKEDRGECSRTVPVSLVNCRVDERRKFPVRPATEQSFAIRQRDGSRLGFAPDELPEDRRSLRCRTMPADTRQRTIRRKTLLS